VITKTRNFLQQFFQAIDGKVRSIVIDGSSPIPNDLIELRKKFIRKCRTLKAEGAAMFYETSKLVTLGEAYPDNLPAHNPRHLKIWQKKLVQVFQGQTLIQGLTGEPIMVTSTKNLLTDSKGREVPGLVMANHALHLALAKWDLWPGSTFLSAEACRTVRRG
jgi:hypothetical protein